MYISIPQQRLTRHRLAITIIVTAIAATLFAGCDSASTDTVVLSAIRADFEFEFDGSTLVVNQLQDLSSNASSSIASQLANQGGFSLDEIVSGRLTSASIELVQPTFVGSGVDLRFLNEVVLQLRSGSTVREVASKDGFTAEEPDDLNVIQGRDISGILRASSFSAVLQVEPNSLMNTSYDIELVLTFTIEVEGV